MLSLFSLCPLSAPAEEPPLLSTIHVHSAHPMVSKYLEIFLAGIQVGCPAIVVTMEPALLSCPPSIRVGRGGTDLFVRNPARFHSQRHIALEV